MTPGAVLAAGFEYGPQGLHAVGRGGAFTAKADDASAIFWNPSRLSLLRGTHLTIGMNMSNLNLTFDRFDAQKRRVLTDADGNPVYGDPSADPIGDPVPFETARQNAGFFPMGLSLGLVTDFGLEDWAFGIGLNGPAAYGKVGFPSGTTSANRYAFEQMDVLVAFASLSVAWKYKEWFGLGASLQYAMVPNLSYSLTLMGPASAGNQNDPVNNINDLRADVDMADWTGFSAIIGAWGRPVEWLELGFSARVVPVKIKAEGDVRMSGTPNSVFNKEELLPDGSTVRTPFGTTIPGRLEFTYPMSVQLGARYRHVRTDREIFDIEVDFAWEQWSSLDAFVMTTLEENKDMGVAIDPMKIRLERQWKDTYSVRLGGQWNAIPDWLTVRLGGWWESASQPVEYTTLDLPSFDRFGIGAGLSTSIYGFEIGLAYAHVFQMSRTVAEGTGNIRQQLIGVAADGEGNLTQVVRPGYAVNEGRYTSSFDVVTIGISVDWDRLLKKRKVVVD
jgi:long-subunit fatty acid transport protein